jgi:predicted component of type VI protein secretion system
MAKLNHMFADHIKEIDDSMAVEILDSNRTIFISALNTSAGDEAELTNCRNTKDVFDKFQPNVEAEVRNEHGESDSVDLKFGAIKDFAVDSVIAQSPTLEKQKNETVVLAEFMKSVGKNATLRKALSDSTQRQQLLDGFKAALDALGGEDA